MFSMRNYSHIDRTIPRYRFDTMECVDPDNLRFAERMSEDSWTFYQITNLSLLNLYEGRPKELIDDYRQNSKVNDITVVGELNKSHSMVSYTIDLSLENQKVQNRYREKFSNEYPNDWKFLSCEDIFLQESLEEIARNVLRQNPHYYE